MWWNLTEYGEALMKVTDGICLYSCSYLHVLHQGAITVMRYCAEIQEPVAKAFAAAPTHRYILSSIMLVPTL